jgi:hypothetical protein
MTRPRWPRSVSALIAMAPPLGAALARRARVRRRKASSWRLEAGSHLLRGLGLVYLIAFTSLRAQILGLYGERGIVPVRRRLDSARASPELSGRAWRRWATAPTLLWLDASDRGLVRICTAGQLCGIALLTGVAPKPAAWAGWSLHVSLVVVGSPFLDYQWDALLAEAGLLGALAAPPGWRLRRHARIRGLPLWLLRLLTFRLHFESGIAKLLSRDPTWRRGTACAHHYETQPLPTPLAFHARLLPPWFHRASTAIVLVLECAVPFLTFGPRRARKVAFTLLEALQALIAATGNFAFFNLLTAVLTLSLLDDPTGARVPPRRRSAPGGGPVARWLLRPLETALGGLVGLLALAELGTRLLPGPARWRALLLLEGWASPFRSVSSYGLFAHMTCARPEIVIEGSDDGRLWLEYELPHKPGDPHRGPRWVAPHQPRLDWQMWFAALSPVPPPWFPELIFRLLEGSPEVLSLFAKNPFPDHPPRYVRAVLHRYRMTDRRTRHGSGRWWHREPLGLYFPPVTLGRPAASAPEASGPSSPSEEDAAD